MREKVLKLIITFPTSADCFALEKICKNNNIPCRIIPVPRVISSGCGLAWCGVISDKKKILRLIERDKIDIEGIYEHMM